MLLCRYDLCTLVFQVLLNTPLFCRHEIAGLMGLLTEFSLCSDLCEWKTRDHVLLWINLVFLTILTINSKFSYKIWLLGKCCNTSFWYLQNKTGNLKVVVFFVIPNLKWKSLFNLNHLCSLIFFFFFFFLHIPIQTRIYTQDVHAWLGHCDDWHYIHNSCLSFLQVFMHLPFSGGTSCWQIAQTSRLPGQRRYLHGMSGSGWRVWRTNS